MTKTRPINHYEARRREAGLTRQELADRIGVSLKTVENWEYGQCRPHPTIETIINHYLPFLWAKGERDA